MRSIAFSSLLVSMLVTSGPALAAPPQDWKPIDPAELQLTTPKLDPRADAEALLWEVRVIDDVGDYGDLTTTFHHYLRVKIFTDRGRETFSTIDIPFVSGMQVRDVAARTTKPDGTVSELKRADVYTRTVLKANDLQVKVMSFAVPAISAGAVIEYRWREVFADSIAMNLRLPFAREIPAHQVRYLIRPLAVPGLQMRAWPFKANFPSPERQRDGSALITLSDVPALVDEEYPVPALERGPWVFISYELTNDPLRKDFFKGFAKALHEEYWNRSRPNDEIRALAAAAATATTDADRLKGLARAARAKVRRADLDTSSNEDRRNVRERKNAADVLKRGLGTADDVTLLFLALARAAGYDARIAAVPSRADLLERSLQQHPFFFRGRLVAVQLEGSWRFMDTANEHADDGSVAWEYEQQRALLGDPNQAIFVETPRVSHDRAVKRRAGAFQLTEDGTLEGTATLSFSGHWAATLREQDDHLSKTEREQEIINSIKKRQPGAEITEVKLSDVAAVDRPYTYSYRLRIPGYAQRTGSRLFLQPAVMQKGIEALFRAERRTSEVYLQFPWTEIDEVRIDLPQGYALEEPSRPSPIDAGAATYELQLSVKDGAVLVARRELVVGKQEAILFAVTAYPTLRQFFDAVHRSDSHTLVLRSKSSGQ